MKKISIFFGFVFAFSFSCNIFAKSEVEPLLIGLKKFITWNHPENLFEESILKLHFNTKVKPTSLIIELGRPNGMSYLVLFDEYAINLNLMAGLHEECLADSFGSISEDCYVQAGEHDFDKDGIPEIIIAIGNGLSGLHVNIFKYYPPEKKEDGIRLENWSLVGDFDGQQKAFIKGKSVLMPFGSQGLEVKMTWVEGKFVCVEGCLKY